MNDNEAGNHNLGRRTQIDRADGAGATTSYDYDAVEQRLEELTHDLNGTAEVITISFGYNPAGQLAERTGSNALHSWLAQFDGERPVNPTLRGGILGR